MAPKKSPRAARDLDRALTFPPPHAVLDRDLRVRQMEAERRPAAARRLGLSPARGFISGAFSSYYDARVTFGGARHRRNLCHVGLKGNLKIGAFLFENWIRARERKLQASSVLSVGDFRLFAPLR